MADHVHPFLWSKPSHNCPSLLQTTASASQTHPNKKPPSAWCPPPASRNELQDSSFSYVFCLIFCPRSERLFLPIWESHKILSSGSLACGALYLIIRPDESAIIYVGTYKALQYKAASPLKPAVSASCTPLILCSAMTRFQALRSLSNDIEVN